MERELECQNLVLERQLCSADVGFVTWRSSSYASSARYTIQEANMPPNLMYTISF